MLIPLSSLIRKYRLKIHGVIHVGAHTGEEHEAYEAAGIADVLWIEADPDVYRQLTEKLGDIDGYMFENALITDTDGAEVTFNIANNEQSSSILAFGTHSTSHPEVEYVDSIKLPTRRLDLLIHDHWKVGAYRYRNFLNLDVQGAELLVLKGAYGVLGDIDYVYTEVNHGEVYAECAQMAEIDSFLKDFKRVETKMTPHSWGDAFYVRKSLLRGRR